MFFQGKCYVVLFFTKYYKENFLNWLVAKLTAG